MKKIVPKTMGGRIRYAREIKEWTQPFLSQKTGIDQAVLSKYENDKMKRINMEDLQKIADALDVTTQYLQDDPDDLKHIPDEIRSWFYNEECTPYLLEAFTKYLTDKALGSK